MTEPPRPAAPFSSALIVTASEGHARVDKEFLKQFRITRLRTASSGAAGLAVLRRHEAEMVLCDAQLDDMVGSEFVAALRADPELRGNPGPHGRPGSGQIRCAPGRQPRSGRIPHPPLFPKRLQPASGHGRTAKCL